MRLLLINANTDRTITGRLVDAARALLPPDATVTGATACFGPRYIATRAAFAVAGHAALDAYAEAAVAHSGAAASRAEGAAANAGAAGADAGAAGADAAPAAPVDVVVLACFGDPGIGGLRELAPVPVLGMAEAACRRVARRFARFSIVTGGALWPAMLDEYLAGIGLRDRVACIRALPATGGAIAADPEGYRRALARECAQAARDDGAEAVLLGGAGLVGIAERIAADVPVPVLCGFAETLREAQETVAAPPANATAPAAPPVETTGLGERLAALLAHPPGPDRAEVRG